MKIKINWYWDLWDTTDKDGGFQKHIINISYIEPKEQDCGGLMFIFLFLGIRIGWIK